MAQLKITWIKSATGRHYHQSKVVEALGLKRLHHTVIHQDSPTIQGMVRKIPHLLKVERVD